MQNFITNKWLSLRWKHFTKYRMMTFILHSEYIYNKQSIIDN